jgi:hypothetical protein
VMNGEDKLAFSVVFARISWVWSCQKGSWFDLRGFKRLWTPLKYHW